MTKTISLLGLQWGDEGKGKVVDHLAKDLDAAIRYQGGHNAGHTLIVEGKKIVFHLLPSAICHDDIHCYIGRGVVVSLDALFEEIEEAQEVIGNIEDRLTVSSACSLIQPYHSFIRAPVQPYIAVYYRIISLYRGLHMRGPYKGGPHRQMAEQFNQTAGRPA